MDNHTRAANIIAHGLKNDDSPARIARHLADYGLLAPDDMTWQEADYRPPRFYTLDETTEKGPNLGDNVTRAKRLVGPWEEA